MHSLLSTATLLSLPLLTICQDGYSGYKLDVRQANDPTAVLYETSNTATSNVSALNPIPDVLLNASVHIGEIAIAVDNLTAKINLDAQVLQLLPFNAGVDLSIDKVSLLIQNVTAKVYLEARLSNLVTMISTVLDTIDTNPIMAELGTGLDSLVNNTATLAGNVANDPTAADNTAAASAAAKSKRNLDTHQWHLHNNILYSTNNFQAHTHSRHVLAQNGDIEEQTLTAAGEVSGSRVVGDYATSMRFSGFNESAVYKGQEVWEEEYVSAPFAGLYSIAGVFRGKGNGRVVGTRLVAEARGGGGADIWGGVA